MFTDWISISSSSLCELEGVCSDWVRWDVFKGFQSVTFRFFNGSNICTETQNIMLELWMKIERPNAFQMLETSDRGERLTVLEEREGEGHINTLRWTSGTHFCLVRASDMCFIWSAGGRYSQMSAIFLNDNLQVIVESYCVWLPRLPLVKHEKLEWKLRGIMAPIWIPVSSAILLMIILVPPQ